MRTGIRSEFSDSALTHLPSLETPSSITLDTGAITDRWSDSASVRRRRPHVFRIVLSHSREGYSEAVFRQSTESFIGALENAFRHFGGVPQTLEVDNLRAAVLKADWFDPDLSPKIQAFAEHYGSLILPTKPRTPRHEGKIEAGVKYVQSNRLKGRSFSSLQEENAFLLEWEPARRS